MRCAAVLAVACCYLVSANAIYAIDPPLSALPAGSAPRAVTAARATEIPPCTLFVDAASATGGTGTAAAPHATIGAAVAAAQAGAVPGPMKWAMLVDHHVIPQIRTPLPLTLDGSAEAKHETI